MVNEKKAPEIRFDGFTEPWEHYTLGDVATFSKGSGYSKADLEKSGTPIILYGRLYTKYENTIDEVDTFATLKTNSVISQGGEVIVPSSGETAEDIARASAVVQSGIILGGDLNIVKTNKLIDPVFLALTISNGIPQRELSKKAQGKSVVHIRNSDLQVLDFTAPDKDEQGTIADFFRNLDDTIALKKQQYEQTVNIKKSMLEKMFPKKGADVPEIRFEGFSGAWEENSLESVTSNLVRGPFGGSLKKEMFVESGYRVYEQQDAIYGDKANARYFINQSKYDELIRFAVSDGDFIVSCSGTIGRIYRLPNKTPKGVINQALLKITADGKKLCPNYFLQYFRMDKFQQAIIDDTQGGAMKNLVGMDKIRQVVIQMPKLDEQIAIGDFFQNLDTLITTQLDELEKLQNIKKACLSKMFV